VTSPEQSKLHGFLGSMMLVLYANITESCAHGEQSKLQGFLGSMMLVTWYCMPTSQRAAHMGSRSRSRAASHEASAAPGVGGGALWDAGGGAREGPRGQ
jgi:hypothetical protein